MIRSIALGGAALLTTSLAAAQPVTESPDAQTQLYHCKDTRSDVIVSFKPEIEVRELVAWATGFTCKEFVLDPRVVSSRKVTIVAPNKLSRDDAYRMFLVALQTIGYTVTKSGTTLRVVEVQAAKRENIPVARSPDGGEQLVRYVYRPSYTASETLTPAFTALKSDAGDVQQIGAVLLITDYASHVKEMIGLAKLIDVPKGSEGIYLLPVRHADASKLAEKLPQLLGGGSPSTPRAGTTDPRPIATPIAPAASRILVDERTNTLIIAATDSAFERVKALVERLDIELAAEGGSTYHVVRLTSAVAEELAKTLTDAISGQQAARVAAPPTPSGQPPTNEINPESPTITGQVRIVAEKLTNSLVVMSSGRDFLVIKELIRTLDVARRQVYIEVVILEASAQDALDLKSSNHAALPGSSGTIVGGVQLPNFRSTDVKSSLADASGLVGGLLSNTLLNSSSLLGLSIPSYALLFQALGSSGSARVVATTGTLGIDNKESKNVVGVDLPFVKGTVQGFGSAGQTQTLIDNRKLVSQLIITPHISADDSVLLDIKHTAEEFAERTKDGLAVNVREIATSVVVHDQHTVVVGGLANERDTTTVVKVPLLGDIPLLGYLFKSKLHEKRKTNLLIMLTPYIIKDNMDLELIQQRKQREHDELAASIGHLDNKRYVPKIDYGRKRGLVEEINRSLISIEQDAAVLGKERALPRIEPGLVGEANR